MTLLYSLGVASFLFTVWFTVWTAAKAKYRGGQTPQDAMVEVWTNIVFGFTINFFANKLIFPLIPSMGHSNVSSFDAFMVGWVFTALSIVRQFYIRWWHNWKMVHGFTWRKLWWKE